MLVRCVFDNLYSFGTQKEFNMFPRPRYRTHSQHKYDFEGFELLKLASLYGANGAGKSNLVKSVELLQGIVLKEQIPIRIKETLFKFREKEDSESQLLAIEFINKGVAFYYALKLNGDLIENEELYISGLGKTDDKLIFERFSSNNSTQIKFLDPFEKDRESQVLKKVIEKNLTKHNKPILKLLSTLDNPFLDDTKLAFDWFDNCLQIISPNARPMALAHKIDKDEEFKSYTKDIMCSFNIGVKNIETEKIEIHDFFGEDNTDQMEELIRELKDSPKKMIGLSSREGNELVVVEENDNIYVKQLKIEHVGKSNITAKFELDEESDGTIRLLDFIPAFKNVVSKRKVYLIDEIERSIHPLLIKELVKKFSFDHDTLGQLIFTTHESNLLDQEIFRQDEIWFAEKDKNGCTDLYSLSDFKEHNTIDVRKGYLSGRYGSIPFLANLQDLNWHSYVTEE